MAETLDRIVISGVEADTIILETAALPDFAGTWHEELSLAVPGALPAAKAGAVRIVGIYGRVRATLASVDVFVGSAEALNVFESTGLMVHWAADNTVTVWLLKQVSGGSL
jgi:hypothetical protein